MRRGALTAAFCVVALALAAWWGIGWDRERWVESDPPVRAEPMSRLRYRGPHEAEVAELLSRVSGWRTPRDADDAGLPPRIRTGRECARDLYVAVAVQYAWAAESDYRLGNPRAARMADATAGALRQASGLCSSAPRPTARGCLTESVWPCPSTMAAPDSLPSSRR